MDTKIIHVKETISKRQPKEPCILFKGVFPDTDVTYEYGAKVDGDTKLLKYYLTIRNDRDGRKGTSLRNMNAGSFKWTSSYYLEGVILKLDVDEKWV